MYTDFTWNAYFQKMHYIYHFILTNSVMSKGQKIMIHCQFFRYIKNQKVWKETFPFQVYS